MESRVVKNGYNPWVCCACDGQSFPAQVSKQTTVSQKSGAIVLQLLPQLTPNQQAANGNDRLLTASNRFKTHGCLVYSAFSVTTGNRKKTKSVAFCEDELPQFCFSLWKPYSADTLWVFESLSTILDAISSALFTAQTRLLECKAEVCDENFRYVNQGHVKDE